MLPQTTSGSVIHDAPQRPSQQSSELHSTMDRRERTNNVTQAAAVTQKGNGGLVGTSICVLGTYASQEHGFTRLHWVSVRGVGVLECVRACVLACVCVLREGAW